MLSPEDSAWEGTPQPLFSPRSAGTCAGSAKTQA